MMNIRVATRDDAEAMADLYRPIVLDSFISFEAVPPTAAEMAARISQTLASHPWLVAEVDGRFAGYAYGSAHRARAAYRWSCDVSCYVSPDAQRRGVGKALYTRLIEILKLQGFHAAHAGIALPNAASVALHEAVGFRPVGVYEEVGFKNGSWRDVGWWSVKLQDHGPDPAEPRPFPERSLAG